MKRRSHTVEVKNDTQQSRKRNERTNENTIAKAMGRINCVFVPRHRPKSQLESPPADSSIFVCVVRLDLIRANGISWSCHCICQFHPIYKFLFFSLYCFIPFSPGCGPIFLFHGGDCLPI